MDLDIEKYRNIHDSNSEWELKKNFLQMHKNSLPIDQLECLTNCYVNNKLYGCKYPDAVMDKLSSLEVALPLSVNSKIKAKNMNQQQKNSTHRKKIIQKKDKVNEHKSSELLLIEEKFKKLRQIICLSQLKYSSKISQLEILTMSCNKIHMLITTLYNQESNDHSCTVLIDHIFIVTGKASKKKCAKLVAYSEAVTLIQKKFHNFVMVDSRYKLIASEHFIKSPSDTQKNLTLKSINANTLSNKNVDKNSINKCKLTEDFFNEFVIHEFQLSNYVTSVNYISQLNCSASFNHVKIIYNISENDDGSNVCLITLNGLKIAEARHQNKLIAKAEAAEMAMNFLKNRCYTIVFKKKMDAETGDTVERSHLLCNDFKNNQIPASNLGNQLLRKLGWNGGGVGKSQGILEPIFLEGVINREGFGLTSERGLDPNLASKVTSSIIEYMHSDKQDDLVFSTEFTKEERNVIHIIAKKYHLVSKSYGKEDERFLVLSRKRTPMELVKHIEANNGETYKYLLIPPYRH